MNEDMGDGLGPEPCQPIGCDAGYHFPGCIFADVDERTCAHRGDGGDCECNGNDQPGADR